MSLGFQGYWVIHLTRAQSDLLLWSAIRLVEAFTWQGLVRGVCIRVRLYCIVTRLLLRIYYCTSYTRLVVVPLERF